MANRSLFHLSQTESAPHPPSHPIADTLRRVPGWMWVVGTLVLFATAFGGTLWLLNVGMPWVTQVTVRGGGQ